MPVMLLILDGAGLAPFDPTTNAVRPDTLPELFNAMSEYGHATLHASGAAVGLEPDQAGNSEIGHMTIGAGFIVPSTLARIEQATRDHTFARHQLWPKITKARKVHVCGLLSDAGTHGHWRSIATTAKLAVLAGADEVVVHPVLDGVDSQEGTAPHLFGKLMDELADIEQITFGMVAGRSTFCDRSGDLSVSRQFAEALSQIGELPLLDPQSLRSSEIQGGEATFPAHRLSTQTADDAPIIVTSHRADRAVQVAQALAEKRPVFGLIELDSAIPPQHAFFPAVALDRGLSRELQHHGVSSLRVSETCKFPHVTYFFDGRNDVLEGNGLCFSSYPEKDLADNPQMRVEEITKAVCTAVRESKQSLIVANIPNLDQIGHLANVKLAESAAVHVNRALHRIRDVCRRNQWTLVVTSDHGNADRLMDKHGRPFGSHTTNVVPITIIPPDESLRPNWVLREGSLANIAPTVLSLLELPKVDYMAEALTAGFVSLSQGAHFREAVL